MERLMSRWSTRAQNESNCTTLCSVSGTCSPPKYSRRSVDDRSQDESHCSPVAPSCLVSGTVSLLNDLRVHVICGVLPIVEMATSNIDPPLVSKKTPMPPNTLPLPDGTYERSSFFGHNSPVYTCSAGLSTFADDFKRAKANFTHVVDRMLSLDCSCGVGNSSLGTGSQENGVLQEGCLRLPVMELADDSELESFADGLFDGSVDGAVTSAVPRAAATNTTVVVCRWSTRRRWTCDVSSRVQTLEMTTRHSIQ